MANKFIEDFDLDPNQAGELNSLTSKQMVWKIAGWMAEKGVRPTQTEVGRLIHRHAGQTPSKTTLKDALDSFYAQALQTAVTRRSVGQIPSEIVDRLEAIYLQIKEACQLEFAAERQSFVEIEEFLKQRAEHAEIQRIQADATIGELQAELATVKKAEFAGKTQRLALEKEVESLQESLNQTWKEKTDLENTLTQSKQSFEAQVRQINAEHQGEVDALKISHQEEIKRSSAENASEMKRISLANHEQTKRLLLQIDEARTEYSDQLAKRDKTIETLFSDLKNEKEHKEKALDTVAELREKVFTLLQKEAQLKESASKTEDLQRIVLEANNVIANLSQVVNDLNKSKKKPPRAVK